MEGLKAERVRRLGSYGVGAADCGGGWSLDENPSIPHRTITSLWHALESIWSPKNETLSSRKGNVFSRRA